MKDGYIETREATSCSPPWGVNQLCELLRPAGGGVYVVSTGLAEQRTLQREIYGVESDEELHRAWRDVLQEAVSMRPASTHASIYLLGVPSDTGAGFTRGANLAPAALRSHLLKHHPDHPLLSSNCIDLGDVRVVPQLLSGEMLSVEQRKATALALFGSDHPRRDDLPVAPLDITFDVLRSVLTSEVKRATTPIIIGGDHSVAWPAFKAAFERWELTGKARLGLLHFDAHTDLLSERLGVRYCFATWAWHANQLLSADGRLAQVGIRASGRDQAHWETTCGVRQCWAHEVHERGARSIAEELIQRFEERGVTALYVSNDIDGTDERFASATGTPEPDGLTPDQVNEITELLGARFPLIGADLVEVAPPLSRLEGEPQRTFETASRYLKLLGELALKRSPIQ